MAVGVLLLMEMMIGMRVVHVPTVIFVMGAALQHHNLHDKEPKLECYWFKSGSAVASVSASVIKWLVFCLSVFFS